MAKGVACLICMHASTIPVYTQARLGHAVIIAVVKDALAVRVVDLAVRVRRILEEWASFFKEWATFPSLAAEPVASLPWWPQQLPRPRPESRHLTGSIQRRLRTWGSGTSSAGTGSEAVSIGEHLLAQSRSVAEHGQVEARSR